MPNGMPMKARLAGGTGIVTSARPCHSDGQQCCYGYFGFAQYFSWY